MYENYKEITLIDELTKRAKLSFISDLHVPRYAKLVHKAAQDIEADWHTVAEWNDAIAYITNQKAAFETAREAKEFLLAALEESAKTVEQADTRG